jgi:hypothetical protein
VKSFRDMYDLSGAIIELFVGIKLSFGLFRAGFVGVSSFRGPPYRHSLAKYMPDNGFLICLIIITFGGIPFLVTLLVIII